MARFADGELAAFDVLYRRYRGPVYRYLLRNLRGDEATAADLFQDVWFRLVDRKSSYRREGGSFRSYLFTSARNRLIDHLRSSARRSRDVADTGGWRPDPPAPVTDGPAEQAEIAQGDRALRAALSALPPEQRDAFLLKEESGLSVAEIAGVMGVGYEAAKSRLRYAVGRLRAALAEED